MSDEHVFSRIRSYIADHKVDGPDTVVVLEGFRDADEIQLFYDSLYVCGVLKAPAEERQ